MEDQNILDEVKPIGKIYNEKSISLGAFFGGPIAAGYLLIENYKSLGKDGVINKAWIITIISSIAFLGLAMIVPDIKGINAIFAIVCVTATRPIFKQYQEPDVNQYIEEGGELHSNWRVFGISTLILVVFGSIMFAAYMMFADSAPTSIATSNSMTESIETPSSPTPDFETKSYGDAAHVIVYNQAAFSENEIDAIAQRLTSLAFFNADNQKYVYLEKKMRNYEFSITDASADINDSKTKAQYTQLRTDMEDFLKDGKVSIILLDENLDEVLERFD